MYKNKSGILFTQIDPMASFPGMISIHISNIYDAAYHLVGKKRSKEKSSAFQYTLSGYGILRDGHTEHRLSKGYGFLFNINDPVVEYFYPEDAEEDWTVLWCTISAGSAQNIIRDINARYGYVFHLPGSTPVIKQMISFCKESIPTRAAYTHENTALTMELITSLLRSKTNIDVPRLPEEIHVRNAVRIIEKDRGKLYSVSELAQEMNISREHLSRIFRSCMHSSPYEFIISQKIEMAKSDLKFTTVSIKEISFNYGFTSPVQFCVHFKKLAGMTPREYRYMYIPPLPERRSH
ncbi:AraC family transcriptional regulator [Spirochaetota bacterium]